MARTKQTARKSSVKPVAHRSDLPTMKDKLARPPSSPPSHKSVREKKRDRLAVMLRSTACAAALAHHVWHDCCDKRDHSKYTEIMDGVYKACHYEAKHGRRVKKSVRYLMDLRCNLRHDAIARVPKDQYVVTMSKDEMTAAAHAAEAGRTGKGGFCSSA